MPYAKVRKYRKYAKKSKKMAKLNPRQIKEVKMIMGKRIESKFKDTGFGFTSISSSPTFTKLSTISQAISEGGRVGDVFRVKKLTLRLQLTPYDNYNTVRAVIFRFNQDDSLAAPAAGDVYDTSATGSEYVMCPVPNLEQEKKVKVLWDRVFTLPQTITYNGGSPVEVGTSASIKTVKLTLFGRRLGAKNIRCNPGASSGFGHIYLALVSDSSSVGGHPQVYLNSRLEYTDS